MRPQYAGSGGYALRLEEWEEILGPLKMRLGVSRTLSMTAIDKFLSSA